jgi:hypothetical protein
MFNGTANFSLQAPRGLPRGWTHYAGEDALECHAVFGAAQ